MNRIKKSLISLSVVGVLLTACSRKHELTKPLDNLPNDVVLQWSEAAFLAKGPEFQHSLLAARINTLVHLAMHDAINAVSPEFEQYAFKQRMENADAITAAASAAHTVLLANFPEKKIMLDSFLLVTTSSVKDEARKANGMNAGKQAANAILGLRANDGSDADPIGVQKPSAIPGVYNVVPPFNFVFAPTWKTMKPFGLNNYDQFRCAPPPALTSELYTKDFSEVKQFGVLGSQVRTQDQTFYARFWYEFSEIGWNRVAGIVAKNTKADLHTTARAFALVNMALVDSYIAGWDSKYHYNFWRPFTAIRAAASDGNDYTNADLNWEPLAPTPPVQDYPSTHSALGNAAAKVLANIFGNNIGFHMSSTTSQPAGATRTFNSISQAANENADSRVMAGIHFRFSCNAGQELGDKVGAFISKTHLRKIQ